MPVDNSTEPVLDTITKNNDINISISSTESISSRDNGSNMEKSGSEIDMTDRHAYLPVPKQHDARPHIHDKHAAIRPETCKSRTETILARIQKNAPGRVIRRILKCTIAFFIATLFSTIIPLARVMGQAPYIVCSGCILSHPGRTVGAQLDATLTSVLGIALAILYGLAGVAAATAYNKANPDSYAGSAINCIFLMVGVFVTQLLRQKFPKLHFFSMQFMIVLLFTMVNGVGYKELPLNISTQYGIPFMIGTFVSLLANLLLWPETAVEGLGRSLNYTLHDTKKMLDTIAKQFFLDPKSEKISAKQVDELAEVMRQDMMKVHIKYKEAKYEISYAYSCSSDLNPVRHALDRVTKHLSILSGSLKTEQLLFKSEFTSKNQAKNEKTGHGNEESDIGRSSTNIEKETTDGNRSSNEEFNSNEHPHHESRIHQASVKAVDSYIKTGTYSRPNKIDLSKRDSEVTIGIASKQPRYQELSQNKVEVSFEKSNESSIRFDSPPILLLSEKQKHRRSRSATNVNHDQETRTGTTRKSRPLSLLSFFSATQSNISSNENNTKSAEEEDYSDTNQSSTSSLRSYLNLANLSGRLPKPPQRSEKVIGSSERQVLKAYLENLRDPLLSLAVECGNVLECVRDSLCDQLDMSNDDDMGIQHKSIWRYILHTLKIKTIKSEDYQNYINKKKRSASFLCNCAETIRLRIQQFDRCEKERMKALYKINLSYMHGDQLDLGFREELFLVFFFIFTLREVAMNLEQMAEEMRKLQEKTQAQMKCDSRHKKKKRWYMPQVTSRKQWRKWFHSSSYRNVQDRGGYFFGDLQNNMPKDVKPKDMEEEYRLTQMATNFNRDKATIRVGNLDDNDHSMDRHGTASRGGRLRKRRTNTEHLQHRQTRNEAPNKELRELESGPVLPLSKTSELPLMLRTRYQLWLAVRYLQSYEFKFALKLSIAVGALTIPGWVPGYAVWFAEVRGVWAALTVIAIMSPTSGGTLSAGLWRLLSTLIGAFAAWAVLAIDGTSGVLLSGFAVVLALPFFYIHFSTPYSKVSLITLITYVIIALSQYVAPYYSDSTAAMVWLRTATLIVGLVAALLLNWTVWPFIARDATRKTLAGAIGDLGDYYAYVMGTFIYHDEGLFPTADEFKEAERMEHKLEKMLTTCDVLLELTDMEPRLKGPFPKEFYKEKIVSAHNLLDRLMSLRVILMKMPPDVKKDVRDLDRYLYRRDMVASILLHFYTLSASLKAKIPLPSFMPSARAARLRLLRHRRQEDKPEKLLRYRNLTWFAMACATEEIIDELEHLTDLVRFIVGNSKFTVKARRLEKQRKV